MYGIEILCVNDGSPDSCGEILERYRLRFPEKIRILNKENGGLQNANIQLSEGEVVFRGKVTSIDKKEIQMEILDSEIAFGTYRVLYNSETPFYGLDGQQIQLSDIEIESVIEVVFSGQVMQSYPPQIAAKRIYLAE